MYDFTLKAKCAVYTTVVCLIQFKDYLLRTQKFGTTDEFPLTQYGVCVCVCVGVLKCCDTLVLRTHKHLVKMMIVNEHLYEEIDFNIIEHEMLSVE